MLRHPPAVWAKVERLYFEGELGVTAIGKQCGVKRDSIYRRAKRLKWPPHRSLRLEGGSSERATLRRTIALKLAHLEARMKKPDTATPIESERQAREYASLLGTIDKLDSKEKTWRATVMPEPEHQQADANRGDDNVEHWRQELARRIASLGAKWQQ